MKGIILAGGTGSRLYPLTLVTSKQLLPVYDKPMIYYPLSTLMLAGIRDIMIISTPEDLPKFQRLLGDGSHLGIQLCYAIQEKAEGLAQAFTIAKEWLEDECCAMILGDNIFYGNSFPVLLSSAVKNAMQGYATIFGYYVNDPHRFGIVEFDNDLNVISVEEKPENPKSNYAITGLYFYPGGVANRAELVKPSKRGELEITTLNNMYLQESKLKIEFLGRGYAWLDAGTIESLYDATDYVRIIEERQGMVVSAPEEIAYRYNWIDKDTLMEAATKYGNSPYGKHLNKVAQDKLFSRVKKNLYTGEDE